LNYSLGPRLGRNSCRTAVGHWKLNWICIYRQELPRCRPSLPCSVQPSQFTKIAFKNKLLQTASFLDIKCRLCCNPCLVTRDDDLMIYWFLEADANHVALVSFCKLLLLLILTSRPTRPTGAGSRNLPAQYTPAGKQCVRAGRRTGHIV